MLQLTKISGPSLGYFMLKFQNLTVNLYALMVEAQVQLSYGMCLH